VDGRQINEWKSLDAHKVLARVRNFGEVETTVVRLLQHHNQTKTLPSFDRLSKTPGVYC
jgi:hypothetical protein